MPKRKLSSERRETITVDFLNGEPMAKLAVLQRCTLDEVEEAIRVEVGTTIWDKHQALRELAERYDRLLCALAMAHAQHMSHHRRSVS